MHTSKRVGYPSRDENFVVLPGFINPPEGYGEVAFFSSESYRVLIFPAMKAVKYSNVQKALEFYRKGGTVIAFKCTLEASDRVGRNDQELDIIVKEIFLSDKGFLV